MFKVIGVVLLLVIGCSHDPAAKECTEGSSDAKCGPIFWPKKPPVPKDGDKKPEVMKEKVIVHFKFDSSLLEDSEQKLIDKAMEHIVSNSLVSIVGHTDSQGADSYNIKLSLKRANAVADYLKTKFKIDPKFINIEGKGESELLNIDRSIEDHRQNRRSVLLLEIIVTR